MNLNKEIVNLKGETYEMSYPSASDIEAVKKAKNINEVTKEDLPRETVQNIILNCITNYSVVTDKKEVFYVSTIAQWLLSKEKGELAPNLKEFLFNNVIPQSTARIEKTPRGDEQKGLYMAWVMAQVYEELGHEFKE